MENIYYHFFDRELRESVNAKLTDSYIQQIMTISLFVSNGICYAPISNIYESYFEFPDSIMYLSTLNKLGIVKLASSHDKIEGFLLSRHNLYHYDQKRYPMYFKHNLDIWSNDLIVLNDSTTQVLRTAICNNGIKIPEMESHQNFIINEKIHSIIENRKKDALTFSLFKKETFESSLSNRQNELIKSEIHKYISVNYTKRYLDVLNGHLITGIHPISFYDHLEKNKFSTNFEIVYLILKNAGIDLKSDNIIQLILSLKMKYNLFSIGYNFLRKFLNLLENEYDINSFNIHSLNNNRNYLTIKDEKDIVNNMFNYLMDISKRFPKIKEEMLQMDTESETIAIIAVTKIEMQSILNAIRNTFSNAIITKRIVGQPTSLVYHEILGYKQRIVLIQSGMGISGSAAIINTLNDTFTCLNPTKVFMVGIGFGSKPEKQNLGDVLVSNQVWNYEPCKINGDERIPRGDKISASSFLLQLFHTVELDFEIPVHFGLIASGEKLINSQEKICELMKLESEIIGGDMESAGLASVCNNKKVDWIVIKAICDWGMDKTDNYQTQAADNACAFLLSGLKMIIN